MALKFRLRGLAETFVSSFKCSKCGNDGGESGEEQFTTEHTKVTFDGIVVVVKCEVCSNVFVPHDQKLGVINKSRLKAAVHHDSEVTGCPIFKGKEDVSLDVERMNAQGTNDIH